MQKCLIEICQQHVYTRINQIKQRATDKLQFILSSQGVVASITYNFQYHGVDSEQRAKKNTVHITITNGLS